MRLPRLFDILCSVPADHPGMHVVPRGESPFAADTFGVQR